MTDNDEWVRELGRQMLEEASWVCRAKAAERLGQVFCSGSLSTAEQLVAEEYFRLTRFDGEVLMRRVLAESLKRARMLSRDTLLLFADDRAEVAAPLIEHSPLLDEPDLLRIVDNQSAAHRLAVARRFHVAEPVSDRLLASGDECLITTLLRNRGAAIREDALWRLIASAPIRPAIIHALARRRSLLPPRILAMLVEVFAAFSLANGSARTRPILGEIAFAGVASFGGQGARGRRAKPAQLLA